MGVRSGRLELQTRRRFLITAGTGLATLLAPTDGAKADTPLPDNVTAHRFYTRPDLQPPTISVSTAAPTMAKGYAFVAPFTGPGQYGPLIVDDSGQPVWFRPSPTLRVHDFRVQKLMGQPVLTWWEGQPNADGYFQGDCVIADTSYRILRRLTTSFITEEHEFLLTSRNTALISAINVVPADLSAYGASSTGNLIEGVFQEIDLATGKVLLDWHSSDHVGPDESYISPTDTWDYFHLNSVGVTQDGNLLLSARHTSGVYKLDRQSGAVIWHLGGKKNDFELGPGTTFAYQHDARSHPGGLVSIFDDGASTAEDAIEPTSRAIVVALDESAMTAQLEQEIPNPHGSLTMAMGNMQLLPDGGWFVGWGTIPELSEFSPAGELRFDASFVGGAFSYRAYRHAWKGRPTRRPDIAASGNADGTLDVFASWNGATEVSHWQFLGGTETGASALRTLRTRPRSGFETSIRLDAPPPFVAAVALDASGRTLGRSRTIHT